MSKKEQPHTSASRIRFLCEILTEQMNHWLLFPLPLTVMGCLKNAYSMEHPDFLMWIFCGILPPLFYLVRVRFGKFIPYCCMSLILLALTFVFPVSNVICRGICILCGGGYAVHSFILRVRADSAESAPLHPAAGIALSVAGLLFLHHAEGPAWDFVYALNVIWWLSLYLIIYYIRHYLDFLSVNASSSGSLPASEMFRSGFGLVLVYTLFGTILLLLCLNVNWLEKLLQLIKTGLFAILRFLFSLFPHHSQENTTFEQELSSAGNRQGMPELPAGESSLFWKLLEYVCFIAFACLILFCVFRLVLRIVRFLRARFLLRFGKMRESVNEQQSALDFREKCVPQKTASVNGKKQFFSFLTPQERIRRLYRKKLQKALKPTTTEAAERLSCCTARQAEASLHTDGMAALYEKARYSSLTVSPEDVRQMKEACK